MNRDEFNGFCITVPATTYVVQRSGAHVQKVGVNVIAIDSRAVGNPALALKASDLSCRILIEQSGLRPPARSGR